MWKSLKSKTSHEVEWTRLEARIGAGMPDINGAAIDLEFWLELKVCKTKKYSTAGLWRPMQVSWQMARSKKIRNVWNVVSWPDGDQILIYGCQKVMALSDGDKGVMPDLVLHGHADWSVLIDHIRNELLGADID